MPWEVHPVSEIRVAFVQQVLSLHTPVAAACRDEEEAPCEPRAATCALLFFPHVTGLALGHGVVLLSEALHDSGPGRDPPEGHGIFNLHGTTLLEAAWLCS